MKFRGLNHSSCLHFWGKKQTLASPSGHTPRVAPDSARTPVRHSNQLTLDKSSGLGGTKGTECQAGPGRFQPGGRRREKTAFTA